MSEYALVTGGSRNIGRAICARLAADGYRVFQLDQVAPEGDPHSEFIQVDMSDEAALATALETVTRSHEITRVVNNVGMGHVASVDELSLTDFDMLMRINTRTAVQCTQALLPAMRAAGFGRVVNLASRAVKGVAGAGAYAATKG
ncbi:MAG: SDR family NAD(P)-dependent oxidoreductase, partial [Chromatiales bacterium]|nr:SDR family NAD(P)-dependent oxidoreductase [Chromatiales bacterium]